MTMKLNANILYCFLTILISLLSSCTFPDPTPEKFYRQVGDSEIGKQTKLDIVRKYGNPQSVNKVKGSEFWTYSSDLGSSSRSHGISSSYGSATAIATGAFSAQSFGNSFGSSSITTNTQILRDEFTYEFNSRGVVIAYSFWSRRPGACVAYSSRTGYLPGFSP
jgi:hypothetical protein